VYFFNFHILFVCLFSIATIFALVGTISLYSSLLDVFDEIILGVKDLDNGLSNINFLTRMILLLFSFYFIFIVQKSYHDFFEFVNEKILDEGYQYDKYYNVISQSENALNNISSLYKIFFFFFLK
jgi:hypothetical protein